MTFERQGNFQKDEAESQPLLRVDIMGKQKVGASS